MQKHGNWTILSSQIKYENESLTLREDDVIGPNGECDHYTTIKLSNGIQVLAVDNEGFAHLAKEFRYALGIEDIESVGGTIDDGESIEEAARRELEEELGIKAAEFINLGTIHHTTSLIDSNTTLFLALGLRIGEKKQDDTEQIETKKLPFNQVVRMALDGEITHASTCVLVLRANHYLQSKKGRTNGKYQ